MTTDMHVARHSAVTVLTYCPSSFKESICQEKLPDQLVVLFRSLLIVSFFKLQYLLMILIKLFWYLMILGTPTIL